MCRETRLQSMLLKPQNQTYRISIQPRYGYIQEMTLKSICSLLQVITTIDCNHKLKYNWFTLRNLCYQINTKSVGTKLEVLPSKGRLSNLHKENEAIISSEV